MFEKLRGAFSSLAKAVAEKKLSEKDLDDSLYNFQLALMESDVAQNVVESVTGDLKKQLLGMSVERSKDIEEVVKEKLRGEVLSIFSQVGDVDVLARVKESKAKGEPFKILFLGINGTGKTTTVAKFANYMKKNGFSVVIAAGDTHRAGAIEQVTEHAEPHWGEGRRPEIRGGPRRRGQGRRPLRQGPPHRRGAHRLRGEDADQPEPDGGDVQDSEGRHP